MNALLPFLVLFLGLAEADKKQYVCELRWEGKILTCEPEKIEITEKQIVINISNIAIVTTLETIDKTTIQIPNLVSENVEIFVSITAPDINVKLVAKGKLYAKVKAPASKDKKEQSTVNGATLILVLEKGQ